MALAQTIFTFGSRLEQHQRKKWRPRHGVIMAPQQMSIALLANRCAQELDNFMNGRYSDSSYGYELFRRALQQQNQLAWMAIWRVYDNLVTRWVRQHPKFSMVREETAYFANRAFERLWRNVALKAGKFSQFPNLASLLQFLKMCVNAAIIDDGLKLPPSDIDIRPLPDDHPSFGFDPKLDEQINISHYWQLIDSKLQNKNEKIVIYAFFLDGMKPREIYTKYSDIFDSTTQISNIKSNALRRLARIPSFYEVLRDFILDG